MTTPVDRATASRVLDLPMPEDNDAGATTIRGYLFKLLDQLWEEQDDFSGVRPFGHSSWNYDLYAVLLKAGVITGKLDAYGYVEEVDERQGDAVIAAAIDELARTGEPAIAPADAQAPGKCLACGSEDVGEEREEQGTYLRCYSCGYMEQR